MLKPKEHLITHGREIYVRAMIRIYEKSHLVVLGPVSVSVPPSMTNSSSSLSARIVQSIAALDSSRVVSPERGRERFNKSSHSALTRKR